MDTTVKPKKNRHAKHGDVAQLAQLATEFQHHFDKSAVAEAEFQTRETEVAHRQAICTTMGRQSAGERWLAGQCVDAVSKMVGSIKPWCKQYRIAHESARKAMYLYRRIGKDEIDNLTITEAYIKAKIVKRRKPTGRGKVKDAAGEVEPTTMDEKIRRGFNDVKVLLNSILNDLGYGQAEEHFSEFDRDTDDVAEYVSLIKETLYACHSH